MLTFNKIINLMKLFKIDAWGDRKQLIIILMMALSSKQQNYLSHNLIAELNKSGFTDLE